MQELATLGDVTLAAGESLPGLLTPWVDVFNTASENATTLTNNFVLAPGVGLQQAIANQADFWQQIFDDPSSSTVASVNGEIQNNLASVLAGYALQNADQATTDTVLLHTLDGKSLSSGHVLIFDQLAGLLPAPILNFLASPAGGIIMGALGPFISPWIALMNSITDGDDWNATLASMVGAYFNGATLNLDSLVPAINGAGILPVPMTMEHLDIGFGGLLSTGSVAADPYDVGGVDTPAVGGSIFNSIGLSLNGVPFLGTVDIPSQAIGPLGAWETWAQTVAALLGWDGDGAPLAGVELPIISSDIVDDGGVSSSVAADSVNWLHELITGLFG